MACSCIIVSLSIASSAHAASYYIDATKGNDLNDGLSPESAWKTIRRINRETFAPGDEIKFKRGEVFKDHFLYLKPPYSGKKGNPIIFKDYGRSTDPLPILTREGRATVWMIDKVFITFKNLELVGTDNVIEIKQSRYGEMHHVVFKDCVIRNSRTGIWVDTATGGVVEGCEIYNCGIGFSSNDPGFTVRDCKIHDNDCGITVGSDKTIIEKNEIYNNRVGIRYGPGSKILRHNIIRNNTSHGFEIVYGRGSIGEIYYNIFSHNGGDGLLVRGKVAGKIYNNVMYSNGASGIHLARDRGHTPSDIVLKNNILMDNGFEVKVAKGVVGITSDYNCMYHSAGGVFTHWRGTDYNWAQWKRHSQQDAHSLSAPPLFIAEAQNNFRLTGNSPCINSGTPVGLQGTDYYGNPTPQGDFDIGVYELLPR